MRHDPYDSRFRANISSTVSPGIIDVPPHSDIEVGNIFSIHSGRPFDPPGQAAKKPAALDIVAAADLDGKPVPAREWLVPGWIPMRQTTGLYGDGGLGKSTLALQLQASVALGRPWLGLDVAQTPSVGFYCEDDADEVHRRVADICQHHGVTPAELAGMHWTCRVGECNTLYDFEGDEPEPTPIWAALLQAAKSAGARLVIIDTAADVFSGNENRRDQVRLFVQGACNRLAREIDGAVILCAHPSVSGLASGSGTSGSTGWSNTFRSRLYLHVPAVDKDDAEDLDARILTSKKSNYGRRGAEVAMHWRNGVFVPDNLAGPDHVDRIAADNRANDTFLAALDALTARGINVSHAPGRNYAPTMMLRWTGDIVRGFTKSSLAAAMSRLIQSGAVACNRKIRTGPDRKPLMGLVRETPQNAGNPPVTH